MISLLCPSRGRPEYIDRLWRSVLATAANPARVELVVRLDDDDPVADQYPTGDRIRYVTDHRNTLSGLWNDCWEAAAGPVFMHCGDDIVFRTHSWDEAVMDAFPADGIALVHGDDLGGKGDQLATHGFLRAEWIDTVGCFAPDHFVSDYTDLWFTTVADALDRRIFLPDVITEHLHPAFGKAEWDRTHNERIERHHVADLGQIWRETEPERHQWVARLREAMA